MFLIFLFKKVALKYISFPFYRWNTDLKNLSVPEVTELVSSRNGIWIQFCVTRSPWFMLLTGNREVAICPAHSWWRKNVQAVWMSPCTQAVFRAHAEGELMLADVWQDCLESWLPVIRRNSFSISPRCPLGSQWLLSAKLTRLIATVWMWYPPMDWIECKNVFNCLAKSPREKILGQMIYHFPISHSHTLLAHTGSYSCQLNTTVLGHLALNPLIMAHSRAKLCE